MRRHEGYIKRSAVGCPKRRNEFGDPAPAVTISLVGRSAVEGFRSKLGERLISASFLHLRACVSTSLVLGAEY